MVNPALLTFNVYPESGSRAMMANSPRVSVVAERRKVLRDRVLDRLEEPIRESPELDASLSDLIHSVKAQGLEGLVAKRADSKYEPGQRSGAWQKMRVNQGQEFVIAGYTPSGKNFDALIFGYYEGDNLMYAGRTRNGFTPATERASLSTLWLGPSGSSEILRRS